MLLNWKSAYEGVEAKPAEMEHDKLMGADRAKYCKDVAKLDQRI